jgi:hypothetical protein
LVSSLALRVSIEHFLICYAGSRWDSNCSVYTWIEEDSVHDEYDPLSSSSCLECVYVNFHPFDIWNKWQINGIEECWKEISMLYWHVLPLTAEIHCLTNIQS